MIPCKRHFLTIYLYFFVESIVHWRYKKICINIIQLQETDNFKLFTFFLREWAPFWEKKRRTIKYSL